MEIQETIEQTFKSRHLVRMQASVVSTTIDRIVSGYDDIHVANSISRDTKRRPFEVRELFLVPNILHVL